MKVKTILFIICVLLIRFIVSETFATNTETPNVVCNFYINDFSVSVSKEKVLILSDSLNKKELLERKIAPGTNGSFEIKINIAENTYSKYKLSFANFSNKFPENLKFYYNREEIDIYSWSLENIQVSQSASYLFTWNWNYENQNDTLDLIASQINELSFDIVLVAEYNSNLSNNLPSNKDDDISNKHNEVTSNKESLAVDNTQKVLPRSGDIRTNF